MGLFNKNKYPKHVEEQQSARQQAVIFIWEIFKVVVISIAIIVPIRYYLIKPFYVRGASMEPNFYENEYLIIDELTYRFSQPERGDIVVFRYPFDRSQYFIKRVIGIPGEQVRISGGNVYIFNDEYPNGIELEEGYLAQSVATHGDYNVQLGEGEYYLLGDNRLVSQDSRSFGPVKESDIIGRTLFRGWPINKLGLVTNSFDYKF